ncbi:MAG: cytochrome P450 [Actinobacteria bacterium]|nr:cytochrome P450 [Actinomycetota bacterium]
MTLDPTQLAEVSDPYPLYAAQRAEAPVARAPSGFWCVTGYDEAEAVLRDSRSTTGPIGARYREALPDGSAARTELGRRINLIDPPDHTRVRGLVGKAFTPRRVEQMREWIATLADRLLADAETIATIEGAVDLLPVVAHPLPSLVISELLGVPGTDRALLSELTEATAPLLGVSVPADDWERGLDASERFAEYVEGLLAERAQAPGDDLLSALIAAEEEGDRLTHEELMSLVVTLYAAGHRTTRDLFTNGLAALLRAEPAQRAAAADDPKRATEEFVRFATPTHFVGRVPVEPMEVAGEAIGPYEPVLVFLAAANRDPRRFADPERLDVTRAPDPPPLSFALGPHFCLGASLARTEVEILVGATLRRWPEMSSAEDDHGWWTAGPFRGLKSLRVRLG